jgi:hypothetical protein
MTGRNARMPLRLIVLLLAGTAVLRGQDTPDGQAAAEQASVPPDAVEPVPPTDPADANPLPVTTRADRFRDPFWPVGWEPDVYGLAGRSGSRNAGGIRLWQDAMRRVDITGLIRTADGAYLANVRGVGVVEVGDIIWVDYDGMTYKWRVRAITERGIVPERVGVSPMRAPARQTE